MNEDSKPSPSPVRREQAGPIRTDEPSDSTLPTVPNSVPPDFQHLFSDDVRVLTSRVLRMAAAVCANDRWPDALERHVELLTDLQRLCRATETELGNLRALVERELARRG